MLKKICQNILFLTICTSCGDSSSDSTQEQRNYIVTTKSNLPLCAKENAGNIGYTSDTKETYVCDGSLWIVISSIGPSGAKGETGPSGAKGETGPSGAKGETGDSQINLGKSIVSIVKPNESAIINIECSLGRGTGTKIDNSTIVTAKHVVDGTGSCAYKSGGLQSAIGGRVEFSPSGRDIAYIKDLTFSRTLPSITMVKSSTFSIGDFLLLVSFPLTLINDPQYTFGYITDDDVSSSLTDMQTLWDGAIMTDMPASSGSSGGPVFNLKGEFIGIHVGGFSGSNSPQDVPGLELNYQLIFKTSD